ncbi:hypothetical protein K438DRAFT_1729650 [Mycena galopus ATCC 62051]|nr:hypothetical protein K438DRAFT_1729650 [Mycena galopus ATCC 62051]
MNIWRPQSQLFLDEIALHDGVDLDPRCALCASSYDPGTVRLFKCVHCGEHYQCEKCCIEGHARNPLHSLKEWKGEFWVDRSLYDLGLIYQLGHGGLRCPYPDPHMLTMVVINLPFIHHVWYRYCKCQKGAHLSNVQQCLRNQWYPATITDPSTCATFLTLETFRLQNVVGNMNAHDFITAIKRQTNVASCTGIDWIPVCGFFISCGLLLTPAQHRYKEFIRMSRQWAFLKRIKRAGRAHDPLGLSATVLRECAVRCWACPHDGRNLPTDWRDVSPKDKFLYMLLVALDANFRLKNRMRPNEHPDSSLGPGWGYFVEPERYREHLKNYVAEKDISTCIAFAALLQKDTRGTTGLRTSGVGGCVCARHECVLPNGIGDLQKGERFANMDFILLAAIAGFALQWLTISYDISCQWKRNFPARNAKMPQDMQLQLNAISVQCALPVWHAGSHEEVCQSANSLSYKPGVGRSDGEGVERTWSVLNPAAFHTKDMSQGNRVDTLEDKIDSHNFLKNLGLGDSLHRKLALAREERDQQVKNFEQVSLTVERDVRTLWQKQINEWLQDETKPNPYTLDKRDGPTEAQVRAELKREEERDAASGKVPLHGTSATAFLAGGLQIEDAQRRIIAELAGLTIVSPDRDAKVRELRLALLKKVARFRELQAIYMPGAARAIVRDEAMRDPNTAAPRVEHVKVYMPHELPEGERGAGCVPGLTEMEAKMRVAQCTAALTVLRGRLHAKRHFITFRNDHLTGQKKTTKAGTLIQQLGERVNASAGKYRKGFEGLVALKGKDFAPHFRELKDDDIRLDGDNGESDAAARRKLAMLSAGRGARAPRNAPGKSKRLMSWIWTAKEGSGDDAKDLHDAVRVEWARAKARKTRWEEEVQLLEEEMRRTLRYLEWQASWWETRQDARPQASSDLRAALRAYALKQAWLHRRLRDFFKSQWNAPAVGRDTVLDMVLKTADLGTFLP